MAQDMVYLGEVPWAFAKNVNSSVVSWRTLSMSAIS